MNRGWMGGRRRDHTPLPAAEGAGPTSWPPACPTEPAPRVFLSSVLSPKHRDRAAHTLGLQGLAPASPHQRGVPGQPGEGQASLGPGRHSLFSLPGFVSSQPQPGLCNSWLRSGSGFLSVAPCLPLPFLSWVIFTAN